MSMCFRSVLFRQVRTFSHPSRSGEETGEARHSLSLALAMGAAIAEVDVKTACVPSLDTYTPLFLNERCAFHAHPQNHILCFLFCLLLQHGWIETSKALQSMRATILFLLFLGISANVVFAGPGTHRYEQAGHSNYGEEKSNKQHIMEHIKTMAKDGADPPQDLSENELIYYLFVLHDTNADGHLDGHELRAAFTDFDEDEEDDLTGYVSLEEVTDMVDHVLEEDDINGDGLISWEEYLQSQLYHGNGGV
ncbi:hypothetical protein BX666DRAFT_815411 [Dichotomocladium elegans]|nr:hypothetical protein BX666DRAFT_815411 [Dichotomocladium elegans]